MIEIALNLNVGTTGEIDAVPEFKIVNLARTYHYTLHEWKLNEKRQDDKCYIIHEDPRILSLNWVDAEDPKYFDYQGNGVKNFKRILDFIDKSRVSNNVLIACNKGESRSPSIGMLYLAKRTNLLSRKKFDIKFYKDGVPIIDSIKEEDVEYISPTYDEARQNFYKIYNNYYPAQGITSFLIDHWDEL